MEGLAILGSFRSGQEIHGYGICRATGLPIGTVYSALHRFEERGLLHSRAELVDQTVAPRVPKVLYQITDAGFDAIRKIRMALGSS